MKNVFARVVRAFVSVTCAISFSSAVAQKSGLAFAGVPFSPGATVQADVPLTDQEKSLAATHGNTAPPNGVATIGFPPNFDPRKSWPVMVVFSTSDLHRQNQWDLIHIYRSTAMAQGWVLLAGDGPQYPRHDGVTWRAAMTLAAMDAFYKSFPGSIKWPVICIGISGGAKLAGDIAPMLSLGGCRIIGIYLTGINEDHLGQAYRLYHPGADFLKTPVFVSSGSEDKIATPHQQYEVSLSLKRTGFQNVRFESFKEGHAVKRAHLVEAMRWFQSFEKSP